MEKQKSVWFYFWIGGFLGVLTQALGEFRNTTYLGSCSLFNISAIMECFSFWAGAILLLVGRKSRAPKKIFWDNALFFLSMSFFYYLYVQIKDIIIWRMHPEKYTFSDTLRNILSEIPEGIFWIVIGICAAFWCRWMAVLRDKGKPKGFLLLSVPLFLVILVDLVADIIHMVLYLRQPKDIALQSGAFYLSNLSVLLTSAFAMGFCLWRYCRKKPWQNAEQHTDSAA